MSIKHRRTLQAAKAFAAEVLAAKIEYDWELLTVEEAIQLRGLLNKAMKRPVNS